MHNKLWIVDNAAAIVGGRNLADAYFEAHRDVNFSDLEVLAAGPVVRKLSRSYDDYWNSEWAIPLAAFLNSAPEPIEAAALERKLVAEMEFFKDSDYAGALRDARFMFRLRSGKLALTPAIAAVAYDPPERITARDASAAPSAIGPRMRALIESARQEVVLIAPYFIPSQRGVDILRSLARRGVRVRVLTNSLASTDVPIVHAGYAPLRAKLIAAGVELYEMRPSWPLGEAEGRHGSPAGASLHAKAVVIDREQIVIGSMNLDPRSRLVNTEVALLLDGKRLGAQIGALFDEAVQPSRAFRVVAVDPSALDLALAWITEEEGREVRYESEPLAGFWRRVLSPLLGALAPDDFL
jgi:putative cardiolipin synthase